MDHSITFAFIRDGSGRTMWRATAAELSILSSRECAAMAARDISLVLKRYQIIALSEPCSIAKCVKYLVENGLYNGQKNLSVNHSPTLPIFTTLGVGGGEDRIC